MPPGGANGAPLWFKGKNCTATFTHRATLAPPGHDTGARSASMDHA